MPRTLTRHARKLKTSAKRGAVTVEVEIADVIQLDLPAEPVAPLPGRV